MNVERALESGESRRWSTGASRAALALACAALLAACGGTGGGAPTAEPPTEAPPTEAPATEVPPTEAPPPTEVGAGSPTGANPCADEAIVSEGDGWAFVLVAEPDAGERVRPGFTVRGCANVFEATVVWRLAQGDATLAEGFEMASCGTGCVGDFTFDVGYEAPAAIELATLEVYAESAEDGSPIHVNAIPVLLEP